MKHKFPPPNAPAPFSGRHPVPSKEAGQVLTLAMAGLSLFLLQACSSPSRDAQPEALSMIVSEYQSLSDTLNANDTTGWPDYSETSVSARQQELKSIHEQIQALSADSLSEEDRLTYEILEWKTGLELEDYAFGTERMPFISGDGFFTTPNYVAGVTQIRSPADADKWLNKIGELPAFYDQAISNMQRGLADGFVQTRPTSESALAMVEAAFTVPASEDPLVKVFKSRPPSISESQWDAYQSQAVDLVTQKVRPAQMRAIDFFKTDYLPNARESLGASTLPDGKAYYAYLVRRNTGTDMTPDEVFELGQSEISRISQEMKDAVEATGFEGSFDEFLEYLRDDPSFYPEDLQDAIEKASEIAKRADYLLPQYFNTLPRLTYGVRLKPIELEGSSGGYFLGDPEKGIAGSVVMGRDSDKTPLYSLPSWVLHEGVPGHHLQIALGQERTDLPDFRRTDEITVFVEGWALYSEKLGVEMGMYETPYEDFGRLSFEMWRACRLVMDVGIHWKGWDFDQAANCLRENTALPERTIEGETYRYIGWPGQALAYKVGELEILADRKKAEAALGPKFDLRAFHDMVIGSGPMPMTILAERTDHWIDEQKSSASSD